MTRRRRCRICKRLFTPDPRVGDRQRACGDKACQRERHRLACQAWHEHERPAAQEEDLRVRLGGCDDELRLAVVRDECGAKMKVVLELLLRLILGVQRDECPRKVLEKRHEVLRLVVGGSRDETDRAGPAP